MIPNFVAYEKKLMVIILIKLDFQRPSLSWNLFSDRFINAITSYNAPFKPMQYLRNCLLL